MSLSVVDTIEDGIDRLTDRRQYTVFLGVALSHLALTIGTQSQLAVQPEELASESPFGEGFVPEELPLALEMPLGGAILLWLAGLLALVTASLVALRALRSPDTSHDPGALAVATAHGIVAAVLGGVAVAVGLIALVIPGVFLATALAFTHVYVAGERANAVEAMRRSWALTRGNRLRVFGVLVASVVSFFAITFVGAGLAVAATVASPVVAELVNVGFTALAWLFVLAVLASAFDRLEDVRTREERKWEGVDDELLP